MLIVLFGGQMGDIWVCGILVKVLIINNLKLNNMKNNSKLVEMEPLKLAFDGWFRYYKGLIYCNGITSIVTGIYNKGLIVNGLGQPPKSKPTNPVKTSY